MYSVDSRDRVVKLIDVPPSSVGAPCPMVIAGEQCLHLAYYIQERPEVWDGMSVRVVDESSSDEPVALVEFMQAYAHMFGPPNDEAFAGHPLSSRGLELYSISEVRESSWIRRLERMNAVHPCHKPEHFARYRHLIFAFHDTTFECVTEAYSVSVHRGSVAAVLARTFRGLSKA